MKNLRCEKAVEKKHNGYNCAQAVACSFCKEASMDEDTLKKITQGFGAGLGTMAGTCGAISGAAVVAGLINQDKAGSINKKAFRTGGKDQGTAISISGKHFQVVGFAGFQAEQAEHVGAAGFQHSLAVQLNPERGRGGIAGVVLQLKTGGAGAGRNESEFHTIISSIKNEKSFEIQQEMC